MTKYTLYGWPNTASTSIRWLLAELGAPYTYIKVNVSRGTEEQRDPAYRALNPKGRIPTLLIGDAQTPLTESGAIALYLGETHPDASLLPAPGSPGRAKFLETYTFLVNSHLPAMRDWLQVVREMEDGPLQAVVAKGDALPAPVVADPAEVRGVRKLALRRIVANLTVLEGELGKHAYLAGDDLTVIDFVFTVTTTWEPVIHQLIAKRFPNLQAYTDRIRSRPTWQPIAEDEGVAGDIAGVRDWQEEYAPLFD
ncbi:hypothetical protein Q8F55_005465 [Vanrija albida]|uniref:GST N-terminal domain-containing protein n=1 Tax=Vanrija albida TaxID=181172 RepID=A0ABR3Q2H3_9TREE